MKIVIFGDSITNGYDHTDHSASNVLKEMTETAAKLAGLDLEVELQGVNGETTTAGLRRVSRVIDAKADKVLIFFGANDSATYEPLTEADFLTNLSDLTEKIGAEHVILLTPPWHDDRFESGIRGNDFLTAFGKQTKRCAVQFSLPVIDVFAAMEADEPVKWLQADGLHFSKVGYEKLGKLIVNYFMKLTE